MSVRNPNSEQGNPERTAACFKDEVVHLDGGWAQPHGARLILTFENQGGHLASAGGSTLVLPGSPQAGICKGQEAFVTTSCTSVAQYWYC